MKPVEFLGHLLVDCLVKTVLVFGGLLIGLYICARMASYYYDLATPFSVEIIEEEYLQNVDKCKNICKAYGEEHKYIKYKQRNSTAWFSDTYCVCRSKEVKL